MPSPPSGMHSAPGSCQSTAAVRMSGAGVMMKSTAHSLASAQTAAAGMLCPGVRRTAPALGRQGRRRARMSGAGSVPGPGLGGVAAGGGATLAGMAAAVGPPPGG
eukprot:10047789-Lingulodinium_polyedra.AAC.1